MEIFKNRMNPILEIVTMILLFLFFTTSVISQNNIDFLRTVKTYQDSIKIKSTEQYPDIIDTLTFDLNKYLRIYDKLKLPPNLKCHYMFDDNQTGGSPILYVVKDSFDLESFLKKDYREFIKRNNLDITKYTPKFSNLIKNDLILGGYAYQNNAKKFIMTEDSKVGYLQYLYFNQFGEEFALKWHSNFGQKSVIFSNDELKRFYKFYLNTDRFTCDKEKFKELLNLNPSPIIEMGENSCLITWYEIMTHTGIYKRTYEISRATPYTVEQKENIKILEINAEFIY